jgi:hypothetical protein
MLTVTVGHFINIPMQIFRDSGWDVICGEIIQVECANRTVSASLWYGDLGDRRYQWYEVGYYSLRYWNGHRMPCSVPADKAAAIAADSHVEPNPIWKMAYIPRAIEGVASDSFCDRWMELFALAANNELKPSEPPPRS